MLGLRPGGFEFYEPMCGSLAVGLHVLDKYRPAQAFVCDESPDLINFFKCLQCEYAALVARISDFVRDGMDERAYCALSRRHAQGRDPPATAAAQFYVLDRARRGGRGDALCGVTPRAWAQLHRAHKLLTSCPVHLVCLDARTFLQRFVPADGSPPRVLYCDPPHPGDSSTRCRVGDALVRWAARGAHVVVR